MTECVTNYTTLSFINSKIFTLPYTFIRYVHYILLGSKGYIYSAGEYMKMFPQNLFILSIIRGKRWRICLRHFAKSQKVAGSIPVGVIGTFALP